MSSIVIENIKAEEGFRGLQYDDHLGNPTIGFGTLLPLSEEDAEVLLIHRFNNMVSELYDRRPKTIDYPSEVKDILFEMAYQLGVPKLLLFKKMFKALDYKDYVTASKEMLDSRWARQTPARADRLAKRMFDLG